MITEGRPLHEAVLAGNRADVQAAISAGADVNATATLVKVEEVFRTRSLYGQTPLHAAARFNDSPEVAALLLDRGADVTVRDYSGDTPLHKAAEFNDGPRVATLLLDRGADVNARNDFGDTPLHEINFNVNPEVTALLLDRSADVNARNDFDATPLHTMIEGWTTNPEAVALLLDRGANVNAKGGFDGGTPLHLEMAKDDANPEVAALLLDQGADVEATDDDGNTPLHRAASQGTPKVAALLLDRGADIAARNDSSRTPCQLAQNRRVFEGTPELTRLCASATPAPTAGDTYGPGSTIPGFPTSISGGLQLSGASLSTSGGQIIVTMSQNGGFARLGQTTYTCISAPCRIEGGRVIHGTIRVS